MSAAQRYTNMDGPRTIKVVLLGNSGVGKTCLRSQFVHHMFTNAYKATIGGDYLTSRVTVPAAAPGDAPDTGISEGAAGGERLVLLQIWDTAGQERFNSILQAFYRGADVVVLMYDVTDYESAVALSAWFARFMEHCHVERPGVVVVGNKVDKAAVVRRDEVWLLLGAARHGGPCVRDYLPPAAADAVLEITCKRLELVTRVFERVAALGYNVAVSGAPAAGRAGLRLVGFDIDLDAPPPSRCC